MASETGSRRRKTAAAFTMIELLLVVALMLMLAGAVIIDFGSLDRNARLEEGAANLETLFRYARAEAASTGRQVRIVFGSGMQVAQGTVTSTNQPQTLASTNSNLQVLWEPDPMEAPGRFESLPGAELLLEQVNDLVRVLNVRPSGSKRNGSAQPGEELLLPAPQTANTNAPPSGEVATSSFPPLICYPDGSSDSVEITLAAASSEEHRLALVNLSGLTGMSRHRLIASAEDESLPSGQSASPETRD